MRTYSVSTNPVLAILLSYLVEVALVIVSIIAVVRVWTSFTSALTQQRLARTTLSGRSGEYCISDCDMGTREMTSCESETSFCDREGREGDPPGRKYRN